MFEQVILSQKVNIHARGETVQVTEDVRETAGEMPMEYVQTVTARLFFESVY